MVERKELAQKTKEFRKMDEEGRAGEWKGLLKCEVIPDWHIMLPPH